MEADHFRLTAQVGTESSLDSSYERSRMVAERQVLEGFFSAP
jgi:hypothetical protein